ncbi:MAG TPA: N-acetylmuramoyl-L-alanine amidase [Gemmatimonadaceae bacterium]|nr:N-acetylmuramoyl-L-alanine amidase [Gemmatimonadaceae bacterium]
MMMLGVFLVAAFQAGSLPVQSVVRDQSRPQATTSIKSKTPVKAKATSRAGSGVAHRVIVDAGHGGVDPGAPIHGLRINEKDITLQLALKVGAALKRDGIDVVYTRTRDTLIARADRGKIANDAEGDVFISIHVNAANPGWKKPQAARGFETYFLGVAKTEDSRRVEEMEEESGRFERPAEASANDPLSFILSDMMQNEHLRESSDFAEIVQRRLRTIHPGPDRGVKQAGFTVLVSAFMPAILVEVGFGTNAEEARYLASPTRQTSIAEAIAAATREYLERHERRIGAGGAGGASGRDD